MRTSAAASETLATGYQAFGYLPRLRARVYWPYVRAVPLARTDTGPHDSSGVRMYALGGRLVDHPVAQAMYGIANLESYLLTKDTFYLARARAQADRLVLRRQAVGTAWFFPYRFSFAVHGVDVLASPWYSAMAQGLALTLFTRLSEVTGSVGYRSAATATWNSLTLLRSTSRPWVTFVDGSGYVWLDEYAAYTPRTYADRTVNGHLFAVFGIWEYWRLTGDPSAAHLFDGAVSTMRAYAGAIRTVGWVSKYCLSHGVMAAKYHPIVASQWMVLGGLTQSVHFARMMDAFRADYPPPPVSGRVTFAAGRHTVYRFDPAGRVTASSVLSLVHASQAPGDRRQRIRGHGIYYRIMAGGLAGWWVAEVPGSVVLLGRYDALTYRDPRLLSLPPGTHTAYEFDLAGRVLSTTTVTSATTSRWLTEHSVFANGRLYYLVEYGALAGRWVPAAVATVA